MASPRGAFALTLCGVVATVPYAAQAQSLGPASATADATGTTVFMQTEGTVGAPRMFKLDKPDRLVLDFADTRAPRRNFAGAGAVAGMRMAPRGDAMMPPLIEIGSAP
ncbi:MAG: hypothetical protein AAGD40_11635, partial [Pseudomonadota bacterium]